MVSFSGTAGRFNGVWNWTRVIVTIEDNKIVDWDTQFGTAFPGAGDNVEISGFDVVLSSLNYDHFSDIAGAGRLTIGAGSSLTQTAGGFRVTGGLLNNGSYNMHGSAIVTGAIANNWLMTVSGMLMLDPVAGEFSLSGGGDMRLRGGFITGHGGQSSITDFENHGRISGSGMIGAGFGWASYPSDGGYLAIHNAADGVIEANVADQTLTLHTGTSSANPIENAGVLRASNGATLAIVQSYPHPDFPGHGTTWLTQSPTGRLEALAGSKVLLDSAIVTGGTFHTQSTGVIRAEGFQTRLIDVHLTETARVDIGSVTRLQGAIDNEGEIFISNGLATLNIATQGVTLTGGGSIKLIGGYYDPGIAGDGPGAVLTNVDNTIHGVGWIGSDRGLSGGATLALVNGGTISADGITTHTGHLTLGVEYLVTFTNTGTLQAVDGGTLRIANLESGKVANHGGLIRASGSGSVVEIGTVVDGGTARTANGGIIKSIGSTFDGSAHAVTLDADIKVGYSAALGLKGAVANEGHISLVSRNTLAILADTVLSGGGSVTLDRGGFEASMIVAAAGGARLTNVDNTISGSGLIGTTYYYGVQDGLDFVNGANGKVVADLAGHELLIDTGRTVTNNGVLRADDGGILVVKDKVVGSGSLEITGGSTLKVADAVDFDVTFVGNSHDTLDLRDNGSTPDYDFDILGMGVGDRILVRSGVAGFHFEDTADGGRMRVADDYSAPWLTLRGAYSRGQFELIETGYGDRAFERVLTRDGSGANNTMTAAAGGERLIGLGGNDTLISGAGDDVLDGSRGLDTADYRNATGGVTVSLALSGAQAVGGGQGTDTLFGIENLTGSAHADMLTGDSGDNVLRGGGGNDILRGGTGTDTLTGGSGADIFVVPAWGEFSATVTDFSRGSDRVGTEDMPAIQTLADIAALVKTKSNTANAELTFGEGRTLILSGIDWRALKVSDFARIDNTGPEIYATGYAVDENSDAATTVAASASAWDRQGDRLSYSLSGDDATFFTIDEEGKVHFRASPDFEARADKNHDNVYDLKIIVSDGELSATSDVSVTLHDVNEQPVLSGPGTVSLSVAEGTADAFYKVAASDPENQPLTYALANPEGAFFFDIDGNGNLSFQTPPDFDNPGDLDGDGVYDVAVAVSDGWLSTVQNLRITVTDVNNAPVIVTDGGGASASRTFKENSKHAAASLGATDADGDTLTWSLSGGADKARFKIDADTGVLEFVSAPDFEKPRDANKDNIYQVAVKVSDGTLSDTQTLSIRVQNVNEAPAITSGGGRTTASFKVKENTKAVTKLVALDPDAGARLTWSIADGADKAKFKIDAKTGALSFRSAPDFEKPGDANKDNVYKVKVKVSDGTLSDTQTLSVKVTDVIGVTKTGTARGETIRGTGEQDTLNGKGGNDKLIGGAGADTFVFDTKLGRGNIDRIDDFDVRQDRIRLDDDIFTKIGKVGHLAGAAFWIGKAAHDKSDRIIYDKDTGKLFYDADGKGGVAAIQFATLDKGLALTAGHFDIIG